MLLPAGIKPDDLRRAAEVELGRRTFLDFARYVRPELKIDRFHEVVAEHLDRVISGELKRLMIFAPPQHGKSTMAAELLAAAWLGHHPDKPVVLGSYGAEIANDKSRKARNIVEGEEFRELFPEVRTNQESRAVDRWSLEGQEGGVWAAGIGGALTGRGGGLGIIDDPTRNLEDAESEASQQRTWGWWLSTFRTRMREGAPIVLMMTRWGENDLAGKLLKEQPGEWTVLRIPAIAETQEERDAAARFLGLPEGDPDPLGREPGEPAAPSLFSRAELERIRKELTTAQGARVWQALYQAIPMPAEGSFFKISKIRRIPKAPEKLDAVAAAWDVAWSPGRGDFSARSKLGSKGTWVYVLNVIREQASMADRDKLMEDVAAADGKKVPVGIPRDPSAGERDVQAMSHILKGHDVRIFPVAGAGSKQQRARPFAAQVDAGNVLIVDDGGSWVGEFLEELRTFPYGAHDDQVDATSDAYAILVEMPDPRYTGFGFD